MSATSTGGQAFPCPTSANFEHPASSGMTLRDWFAGMAMQGVLSRTISLPGNRGAASRMARETAEYGYAVADAMLAARSEWVQP